MNSSDKFQILHLALFQVNYLTYYFCLRYDKHYYGIVKKFFCIKIHVSMNGITMQRHSAESPLNNDTTTKYTVSRIYTAA